MKTENSVALALGLIIISPIMYFFYILVSLAPGTHGSQASYSFSKSKYVLESEIDSLITFDPQVIRKELNPPPEDNYYNKDGYFTLISNNVEFCFRYYGDSTNWNKNLNASKIFIAHIRDYNSEEISKEKCLELIEDHFVNKIKGQIKE